MLYQLYLEPIKTPREESLPADVGWFIYRYQQVEYRPIFLLFFRSESTVIVDMPT